MLERYDKASAASTAAAAAAALVDFQEKDRVDVLTDAQPDECL